MPINRSEKDKLALLELADKLNNVSAACKVMAFSRDSYYRLKKMYDQGGANSFSIKGSKAPHIMKRISGDVEDAVIRVSLKDPFVGKHGVSKLLGHQGIKVSPASVRNVWESRGMVTFEERVDKLFEHVSKKGELLSGSQIKACRKAMRKLVAIVDRQKDSEVDRESLEKLLQFETLISELSAQFINLPVDQIDIEIERGQKLVCESLGIHRSNLVEFSPDMKFLKIGHSWTAPGIPANKDFTGIKDTDDVVFIKNTLQKGNVVVVSDVGTLPERQRRIYERFGVAAEVIFPLKVGNDVIGGISWESYGIKRNWSNLQIERLRLISEVFTNALSRKRTEEALHQSIAEIKKLKDQLQAENLYLLDEIRFEHKHHRIIGQSLSIKKVLSQIQQVAGTSSTVLIQGETGTGKELVAHAIHNLSSRKARPMVKVNCSSLPGTLIESELFGHEKGAFSGAVSRRMGRFEVANGSTIFLDEIGDLPLELQSKLLRVLQEGQFERLGSSETLTVDVRVIAATNRDLAKAVEEGRFRKDLYYRLNIFPIVMPSLKERPEDIPLLVRGFVQEFCELMGKKIDTIPDKSLKALQRYDWPGNIRELRNLVERAMIISHGNILHITLPEIREPKTSTIGTMEDMQRTYILQILEKTGWRIFGDKGAAKLVGMNPSTLQSRMKRLGIRREQLFNDI